MNAQTRRLRKLGLCTRNMGPNTQETPIAHSMGAFLDPAAAMDKAKHTHRNTWKIFKNHPANPKKKG